MGVHVREHPAATAAVGEGGGGRDVLANPASATRSHSLRLASAKVAAVLPHLQDSGAARVICTRPLCSPRLIPAPLCQDMNCCPRIQTAAETLQTAATRSPLAAPHIPRTMRCAPNPPLLAPPSQSPHRPLPPPPPPPLPPPSPSLLPLPPRFPRPPSPALCLPRYSPDPAASISLRKLLLALHQAATAALETATQALAAPVSNASRRRQRRPKDEVRKTSY